MNFSQPRCWNMLLLRWARRKAIGRPKKMSQRTFRLAIGLEMMDVHVMGVGGGREVTRVWEDKPRIKPGWVMLKKLMLLIDL
jgi:hypothetical protein